MSIQKSCYFSISPIGGDEIHVTFIKHGTSFILKVILCPRLWSTILGDPDLELSRDWAHSSQFCVLVKRLMVCLKHTTELCNFLLIRYYRDHLEQILHFTGEETKNPEILDYLLNFVICLVCGSDLNSDILSPSLVPLALHSRFPTIDMK